VRSGDLRNKEKIQEDEVGEQWSEMDVGFYKKIKNKREREREREVVGLVPWQHLLKEKNNQIKGDD
jgi:hypothetical protein